MRRGRYRADLGSRRGMRDAHPARSCLGGLKLRFARRPMTSQGLRPPPTDWEGCFAAWKTGKVVVSLPLALRASDPIQITFEVIDESLVWNGLEISKDFPSRRRRFPNQPGTANGRAAGTTTHEARFNVAWATAQTREARSRLVPCLGAVAPKAPLSPRA